MNIGTKLPYSGPLATPDQVVAFAQGAEALGFTHLRVGEHLLYPKALSTPYPYTADGSNPMDMDSPKLEMFTLFSYLAGQTTTIRFQSGVALVALRNPIALAKSIATLDYLSGGRLTLEVGVGWMREEFDAAAVPFSERGAITDETLAILRFLFAGVGEFDGRYFRIPECTFAPAPVQSPFPIYVGSGQNDAALRRIARFAQGWTPMGVTPTQVVAVLPELERLLATHGRSLQSIDLQGVLNQADVAQPSASAVGAALASFRQHGFTSVVVDPGFRRLESVDQALDHLSWFVDNFFAEFSRPG